MKLFNIAREQTDTRLGTSIVLVEHEEEMDIGISYFCLLLVLHETRTVVHPNLESPLWHFNQFYWREDLQENMMKSLRIVMIAVTTVIVGLMALPSIKTEASDKRVVETFCDPGYHWGDVTGSGWYGCIPNEPEPTPTTPPPSTHTCWDGSELPIGQDCPPKTHQCPDGSTMPVGQDCPQPPKECPSGQVMVNGKCQPPPPKTEPTPVPACDNSCAPAQPLSCRTELGNRIHFLYVGTRELREGIDWMQVMDGSKIALTVYDGHLRNSLLSAKLYPTDEFPKGEELEIQMIVGRNTVATNEKGTLVQDGCLRITWQNQSGNDGSVFWSQVNVAASEPCLNKPS